MTPREVPIHMSSPSAKSAFTLLLPTSNWARPTGPALGCAGAAAGALAAGGAAGAGALAVATGDAGEAAGGASRRRSKNRPAAKPPKPTTTIARARSACVSFTGGLLSSLLRRQPRDAAAAGEPDAAVGGDGDRVDVVADEPLLPRVVAPDPAVVARGAVVRPEPEGAVGLLRDRVDDVAGEPVD